MPANNPARTIFFRFVYYWSVFVVGWLVVVGFVCTEVIHASDGAIAIHNDTVTHPFAGVTWTHRQTSTQNIHIMTVDLTHPQVRVGTGLAQGAVSGRGTTSSIAQAQGAQVAINADFTNLVGTYAGVPQNIHVENGVMKANPRYRTAIGFTSNNQPRVGFWVRENPPAWTWQGRLRAQNGQERQLVHMNKDVETGWVCVYTHDFKSNGTSIGNANFSDGTEIIVDSNGVVVAKRTNLTSYVVPVGGYVYIGRGEGSQWLQNNIQVGQTVILIPESSPAWQDYPTIVGGGPAIVKQGVFYSDPQLIFPGGEDFTLDYKQNYYTTLHPRSLVGISTDGRKLYLVSVDGRAASQGRRGMSLSESADLMISLGAYQALSMDGGGSVTMYVQGEGVVNYPSDGRERTISNALLVFSDPIPTPTLTPTQTLTPTPTHPGGECHLLSQGKPATASSYYLSNPLYAPSKAVDGVIGFNDSRWVSNPGSEHWLVVDLEHPSELCQIKVYSDEANVYGDGGQHMNISEYYIRGSNTGTGDPTAWAEVAHYYNPCGQPYPDYPGEGIDAHNSHFVSGTFRYVAIHVVGGDGLCGPHCRLQELMVYGREALEYPTDTPTPVLSATPTPEFCMGDADRNGFVNGDDFRSVRDHFGHNRCGLGDANGDCFVNGDDFRSVRDNFGQNCTF